MDLKIDRYEVIRLIGQGAMGRIYLAADPKLERQVAIKVLAAPREDEAVISRFRLEARAIAALKHPNIVELYDYSGEDAEELYLVMEYIPGRSLYDHVAERGPMSEATALCVAHELTLALEHAHEHNVVHRDIKPDNVLLSDGRIVLTDFGIVKQIAGGGIGGFHVTSQTKVLGTPGFMAPEQFTGKGVDSRTDIFALGALLYFLTTGALPFPGKSLDEVVKRVRSGKYVDPVEYSPLLSKGFSELISLCLQTKPSARSESAALLREELQTLLNAHGVKEVRGELVDYEKNPASYVVEQRERGLEVLMRDLEAAIASRDEARMQQIVQRMQTLAPVKERVRDIPGIVWDDGASLPRLAGERKVRRKKGSFFSGMIVGVCVGMVVTLAMLVTGTFPTKIIAFAEEVAARLGVLP